MMLMMMMMMMMMMMTLMMMLQSSACLTMTGGPESYSRCRAWFLNQGSLYDTSSSCVTTTDPPISVSG